MYSIHGIKTKTFLCRSGSSQFESARNLALKNARGIVLLRDAPNLAQVVASIAAKGVLRLRGVIEVDVLIVAADALGIFLNLCDRGAADLCEELVILGVFP